VGTGRKHHENQKKNIEWKDDSTNLSRKEQVISIIQTKDGVHTRATLRHVIEKRPTPGCREREREKRETGTTKDIWTDGTEGLKRLIEYTKKIGLFHGI
jgi:hypothetical protein